MSGKWPSIAISNIFSFSSPMLLALFPSATVSILVAADVIGSVAVVIGSVAVVIGSVVIAVVIGSVAVVIGSVVIAVVIGSVVFAVVIGSVAVVIGSVVIGSLSSSLDSFVASVCFFQVCNLLFSLSCVFLDTFHSVSCTFAGIRRICLCI